MIIHDVKQGEEAWFKCRLGKFTCSNFDKLFMAKSTLGYNTLINTAVYERITNDVPEQYENDWMKRGSELESEARLRYELETFRKVEQVGFIELDEWTGCSPDGLIDSDGLLEIKCPKYNTFISYALNNCLAVKEYEYQLQGQLLVAGRQWADLFIYHPKMSPLTVRVERNKDILNGIMVELEIAIMKAKERIKHIQGIK